MPKGVPLRAGDRRLAVETEAHPLDYLTFAGVIPPGEYGAGRMTIWDAGVMEPIAVGEDEVKVRLRGRIVDGEYHLVRTGDRDWLVFRAAASGPGVDHPGRRFRALRPMLASGPAEPFDGDEWTFEIKWDGWRALALVTPDATELRSRSGRDIGGTFPRLADLRRAFDCQEIVVDGEICVLDADGRSSFQDLQASRGEVTYVVFDALYIDGEWLCDRELRHRRQRLRAVMVPGAMDQVLLSDDVPATGRSLFDAVAASGGEGIVAKRLISRYRPGTRGDDWRKIKVRHELEAVVCGFLPGEGGRRDTFGALIVAEAGAQGLTYVGRVGSGFTAQAATDLRRRLDRLVDERSPLRDVPSELAEARWVRPLIHCRVAFAERTADGVLRAPVFLGLAEHEPAERPPAVLDVSAPELRVRDGEREVRLTNLRKLFWPREQITKGDVLDHYARCAPVLVPHLADRPMVLKRYPNGVEEPFFFQHELPDTAPDWFHRVALPKSDATITYGVVDDALSLLWVVNLGCIDLNPWHGRVAHIDRADHVLFDLDPQDGVGFDRVAEAAMLIDDALAKMGLRSHPKTSGSRGMHVVVPVVPAPHETVRLFAQLVGRSVMAARPDLVTLESSKARRGARVYIDTNQNGYGKTIASVYSIRPVPQATVSTPVTWDEVAAGLDPNAFTIAAVAARIRERGDLHADALLADQDLTATVEAL